MLKAVMLALLAVVSFAGAARTDEPLPRAASPEAVGLSTAQLTRLSNITRDHV